MPIVLPDPTQSSSGGSEEFALFGTGAARIGGVESIFQYGNLVLNDRSLVDTYIIKEIGGFDDADVRDSRELSPQTHGEHVFDSWYGGRTITLSGTIRAYNIHKLRDMQEALRYEFSSLEDKELRIYSPYNTVQHHLYPGEMEAPAVEIMCRKSQPIQMREAQQNFGFTRDFLITLRAYKPIFTSIYQEQLSGVISSPSQIQVTNIGNFYSEPIFMLGGPRTNVTIQNSTTGEAIVIVGTIPLGATWTLNVANRTFVDQTGANKFSTLDVSSQWVKIVPGINDIISTFSGGTGATTGTIIWKHAWI